jgi:hypothetical protein
VRFTQCKNHRAATLAGHFLHVENITGGGACLKLASTFGVPEIFDLTFEHGRTRRLCRVVWRTNNKLGVAFGSAA